ncbi:MAG: biotin transporter BioY [Parachlamydiales bacterium]|nr:biotin transporter BioY [Parachlamydiales bacterium]
MQTVTLERSTTRDFALVLLGSFIICLSGHISIPLWFTPVPLATQNSMVLLMAALLGARRGGAATFAFLAQGALGLPVFSTGAAGFAKFFGPTGGYLMGYLIAAFVVGYIAEKRKSIASAVVALTVGNLIVYICGAAYLSKFVGLSKAFALGIAPFVVGDLLKTLASLKILQWAGWSKE